MNFSSVGTALGKKALHLQAARQYRPKSHKHRQIAVNLLIQIPPEDEAEPALEITSNLSATFMDMDSKQLRIA